MYQYIFLLLQIFDAIIITSSFIFDIVFLGGVTGEEGEKAAAVLVVLLLWRITRVVDGKYIIICFVSTSSGALYDHTSFKILIKELRTIRFNILFLCFILLLARLMTEVWSLVSGLHRQV